MNHRFLLGLSAVLVFATVAAVWVSERLFLSFLEIPAYVSGWFLVVALMLVTILPLRKNIVVPSFGSVALWYRIHLVCGLLAVVLFFLHLPWRLPSGGLETLLAVLFGLLAVSGLVGFVIIQIFPRRLTLKGEEVFLSRIPALREQLRAEVEQRVVETIHETGSTTLADYYTTKLHDYFVRTRHTWTHLVASGRPRFSILTEMNDLIRYLDDRERATLEKLISLVKKKEILDVHHALQGALRRWLLLHAPLTWALWMLIVLHVIMAYGFREGVP
ncbi:MAG: hypothetical protein HQL84_02205 [Magnetococcales bacterium]|nr:hypothetical protein [Magnetococcales bacterium]MBF0148840.1 hypothetical protein [Magnetococcales bacterium]MBF0173157.1 hypothetical protein [Magnetococcales bacterium]MBF0346380.1 hypothetical protein [Magnetococcales bacterium]MBF0629825.1 hypothetical protein [Magnetococcales bacterium]